MEDFEDLKKLDDIIKKHKVEAQDPDEIEYAELIDYDDIRYEADDSSEIDEYEIPNFTKIDITKLNIYAPSQFLSEAEKKTVDSCTDPILKELLLLNRTKNVQLMHLYKKIKDLLIECQSNIIANEEKIEAKQNLKKLHPRIWRCGIPYFKTADDFPCPRNADVVKKHIRGEMFFYDMTPSSKWTERDMNRLFKGVAFQYKVNRESELESRIRELKKEDDSGAVQELANQLDSIRNSTEMSYPPVGCEKGLDWKRISEQFLNEKYSAQDCQVFWKSYLHPSINKGPWTEEESARLKSLVTASKHRNWDAIAEELGGNRTGFIACVHYYCKIDTPRHGAKFTPEEDQLIYDLVEKYKHGEYIPWTKIAHHFTGKTRAQLFFRYKYSLSCRESTFKGRFNEAEDVLILVLVDRFGKKFTKCREYFPHRSVMQIKARYTSNLKGALKKGFFTLDEDQTILEFAEKNRCKTWEPLVKVLSRSSGQIRQRYNTLKNFQKRNPDMSLDKAPRRRFSGLSYHTEFGYLRLMADQFKSYEKIPTLEDIQRLLRANPKPKLGPLDPLNSPKALVEAQAHNVRTYQRKMPAKPVACVKGEVGFPSLAVDDLLTDFFSNSVKQRFEENVQDELICEAAATISTILSTLQAELYIPKNYNSDARLDRIDQGILEILTQDRPITIHDEFVIKREAPDVKRMLPPTLNSLVGMRSLLIKNQVYRSICGVLEQFATFRKKDNEKQVLWCINNHLLNQSEEVQTELMRERSLLFARFASVFKIPAVMSLVAPSPALQGDCTSSKDLVLKTYRAKPTIHIKAPAAKSDGGTQLSMAERLKRKINDTIKDLVRSPPAKRFFRDNHPVTVGQSCTPSRQKYGGAKKHDDAGECSFKWAEEQ